MLKGPYLGQKPPGMTPEIFAPGIVSTGKEHSAAMFTPDGNEIWFGRMFPEKIYFMKRSGDKWSAPQMAPFCDSYKFLYPVLTRDGQKIFFTSNRPPSSGGKPTPRGRGYLWAVDRRSDGWSKPTLLGDTINISPFVSCGSMAANGNLYFSAKIEQGSHDLFCAHQQHGGYKKAIPMSDINSPVPDHCPFIAPDECYVIFSSFRSGLGRSDLFISFRNRDGTWSQPKNLGQRVNSAYKDEYPYITPDGKYLFFNSNRPSDRHPRPIPDGPGNIYWVDAKIVKVLKPQELK